MFPGKRRLLILADTSGKMDTWRNPASPREIATASLLDAYTAKSMTMQSGDENAVFVGKLHTFALAGFVTAASYIAGGAVYFKYSALEGAMKAYPCNADRVPLSHYANSWMQQSLALMPSQEGAERMLTSSDVKLAQMVMATALDWRFNRATANRFLEVFLARNFVDSMTAQVATGISRDELQASIAYFLPWARYFCQSAVMSNISCHYTQSSIAAASMLAAKNFLYDGSVEPADLDHIYGISDEQELLACLHEILDLHKNRAAAGLLQDVYVSSNGDRIAQDTEDGIVELYCTEDMLCADLFPAVLTPASVMHSTPQTAVRNSPSNNNFVWDTPPIYISLSDAPGTKRVFDACA